MTTPEARPDIPVRHFVERHLGTRGTLLMLLGLMEISRGIAVWSELIAPPDTAVFFQFIPLPIRAALWCTCGLIAIATSFGRTRRQSTGFAALIIMPVERFCAYLGSWVVFLHPGAPSGDGFAFAWAAFWGLFAALIWVLSQVDEDVPTRKPRK